MKKYEIVSKKRLAPNVNEYVVYAPLVAKHALAGQFIILRTDEDGERVRVEAGLQQEAVVREDADVPDVRSRIVEPAPTPEELLQQMDELMKGFPMGGAEDEK